MIYSFSLEYGTVSDVFLGEILYEPQLTADLSKSATAQALSQVDRGIRQESMKAYYSKTTFVIQGVPISGGGSARIRLIRGNGYYGRNRPKHDPLDLWAQTWGVSY